MNSLTSCKPFPKISSLLDVSFIVLLMDFNISFTIAICCCADLTKPTCFFCGCDILWLYNSSYSETKAQNNACGICPLGWNSPLFAVHIFFYVVVSWGTKLLTSLHFSSFLIALLIIVLHAARFNLSDLSWLLQNPSVDSEYLLTTSKLLLACCGLKNVSVCHSLQKKPGFSFMLVAQFWWVLKWFPVYAKASAWCYHTSQFAC